MSTDLYGIRILNIKPNESKVKVKVFVVYYDTSFKNHQPIPKDPSFFLRILHEQGEKNGTIGQVIPPGRIQDEKWVDKHTFEFIKKIELLCTENFPLEDYSSYSDFYYERDGSWTDEEKLVQADYEIEVTDNRYLEHLSIGMSWGTTSYETNAYQRKHADEIFAILEPAYGMLSIKTNEAAGVFSELFTKDCSIEKGQDVMISFFENQEKKDDMKQWIATLKTHLESDTFPENAKWTLGDVIFFLDEIFFDRFYRKVPENLNRENLKELIAHLQETYKPSKNPPTIENESQNEEVRELQRLATRLVKEIESVIMDFQGIGEGLYEKLYHS